jgi:DNA-binding PadR family transcriptional regulator
MSPMVRRSLSIEHGLLGILRQGSMHGYQLHQRLSDPADLRRVWYVKQAQLYALLGKLEEAGYITSSVQPQETRPARRVFHLTETGEQAFQTWLFNPVLRPRQMRQEFQVKLYFACLEGSQACYRLITIQRQACQQWLVQQEKCAEQGNPDDTFSWLVDQYRIGQIRAMLEWLDTCQKRLDQIEINTTDPRKKI